MANPDAAHSPPPATPSAPARRETLIAALLLAVVTFIVFSPVLRFPFVNYDDPDFVTSNGAVQMGLTAESVSWAFKSLMIYWQPLTWVSYMLDFELWGMKPGGYHLTNLLLHLASTVVLFLALKRMTRAHWPSALVAALFALHPLHVETVAWISERKGALSSLFWMLALWAYARYAKQPAPSRYALAALCFIGGLMSKSMVVTLPAVFLLLDFWPLRRIKGLTPAESGIPQRTLGQIALEKAPLFLLSAISGYLTIAAQQKSSAVLSLEQLSIAQRGSHALLGYLAYLQKTFWPANLTVFYPFPETIPAGKVALAALALAGVSALALALVRRAPAILVGWLWFLGVLLPVSGLFQTGDQAIADRYTYIPLIGLFIALIWGAAPLAARLPRAALGAAALVIIGGCVLATGKQLQHWRDTKSLAEQACRATERNHVGHAILGSIYAERKDWPKAREYYTRAISYKERYLDAHFGFAVALTEEGDLAAAMPHYRRALEINPSSAEAHSALGFALLRQNLAAEAAPELEAAVRLKPGLAQTRAALAAALQMLGRHDEAIAAYSQASGLPLGPAETWLSFGNYLVSSGRLAEAVPAFKRATELNPNLTAVLSRLAWILSTHPNPAIRNGPEALALGLKASQLSGQKDPLVENALAAAYAETGDFSQAIETAERAIALASAAGQTQVGAIAQKLLETYRSGNPHRE